MASNDGNQSKEIPPDTQRVVFAENLVKYILQKNSLVGELLNSEQQEESGVSILDNEFRTAADYSFDSYGSYTESMFNFMMSNKLNNIPWFAHYANRAKDRFFIYPQSSEGFLNYSVHLAQLAGKLYAQGFIDAPQIAVRNIVEAMDLGIFGFLDYLHETIARQNARNRQSIEMAEDKHQKGKMNVS